MLRVALAEDHPELRTTLRLFLGHLQNIEVVFVAENGRAAIAGVQQHQPDVLVMDVNMPEVDGLTATQEIINLPLPTRVILISAFNQAVIISAAMAVGAYGFVAKGDLVELLPAAIETVSQGGRFFPENPNTLPGP